MSNRVHLTRCGLPGVDLVPFGMHACHFYRDREELVAALAPYFAQGLRSRERCLWVTAPPLPAREAVEALRAACDGVDEALDAGALRVVDFDQWYANPPHAAGTALVDRWLEEEERALAEGYEGLRITGNTSFLEPGDWSPYIEYEQAVTAGFSGRRIVALCSYHLTLCNDNQVDEVMQAHHCAFDRPGANWQVALPSLRNGARVQPGMA